MSHFAHRNGSLRAEGVPLPAIAAAAGTPAYVYSTAALRDAARRLREALTFVPRKELFFAVKANPNPAVLRVLADEGYGADIVSGGELTRARAAGIAPANMVFSGTGKSPRELAMALDAAVGHVNLELEREGEVLAQLAAARGLTATALLRVNPDVDAGTHAKITTGTANAKFGVPTAEAVGIYDRLAALPGLAMQGIAVHIGSQITDLTRLEAAYVRIGELAQALRARGHRISHLDLGGGLGVAYRPGEAAADVTTWGAMVARLAQAWDVTVMVEPGRFIAADAGVLLTQVLWVKPGAERPIVVVDAGMNDLARPALYDAWHDIEAVCPSGERFDADVVGPVCETSDTFARGRAIDGVGEGDLVVIRQAGAYGATMASSYNYRALVPEVLVDDTRFAVVAERTEAEDLGRSRLAPWMPAAAPGARAA
ncbi:diaminopimelate decarboxylase [Sphingomonas bacterium]|uniref:diaminopimelate decarboxylase n=1 Tax=Sphingomonas bacterium TaxID=1895847 RepID=UPI0015759A52|nr:diaminopimelate decarboxylase [Sphingomonas bacterium]